MQPKAKDAATGDDDEKKDIQPDSVRPVLGRWAGFAVVCAADSVSGSGGNGSVGMDLVRLQAPHICPHLRSFHSDTHPRWPTPTHNQCRMMRARLRRRAWVPSAPPCLVAAPSLVRILLRHFPSVTKGPGHLPYTSPLVSPGHLNNLPHAHACTCVHASAGDDELNLAGLLNVLDGVVDTPSEWACMRACMCVHLSANDGDSAVHACLTRCLLWPWHRPQTASSL